MLGGKAFRKQIDGTCVADTEKTKGAYPDVMIENANSSMVVEIDEHRHDGYNVSCELRRYDTLLLGRDSQTPMLVVRFNPHNTGTVKTPFVEILKVLIQYLRTEFAHDKHQNEVVKTTVQYMFYGEV